MILDPGVLVERHEGLRSVLEPLVEPMPHGIEYRSMLLEHDPAKRRHLEAVGRHALLGRREVCVSAPLVPRIVVHALLCEHAEVA